MVRFRYLLPLDFVHYGFVFHARVAAVQQDQLRLLHLMRGGGLFAVLGLVLLHLALVEKPVNQFSLFEDSQPFAITGGLSENFMQLEGFLLFVLYSDLDEGDVVFGVLAGHVGDGVESDARRFLIH
jgi:hypothetical protein